MELPQVGDLVSYHGRFDNVVTGILAERAISPLTGNPRYRVVDSAAEMEDDEAGRWVGIEEVIGINPPVRPPVETGKTRWGVRYATTGYWRIIYHPDEGGYETLSNVNGIGWVVCDDMPTEEEEVLCFALGIKREE